MSKDRPPIIHILPERTSYLRVPDITVEEARAALWPDGRLTQEAHRLKTAAWRRMVELCCKKWPEAVLVLVVAALEAQKEDSEHAKD